MNKHIAKIIGVVVVFFTIGGVVGWGIASYVNNPTVTMSPTPTPSSSSSASPISTGGAVTFQPVAFPNPSPVATIRDPGVVWLDEPILVSDLGLFREGFYATYYQVGIQNGKDIYLALIYEIGESAFLLRKENGRYALLNDVLDGYAGFTDSVYLDSQTKFASLRLPSDMRIYGVNFSGGFSWFQYLFDSPNFDSVTRTLFAYTPYGPMYVEEDTGPTASEFLVASRFVIRKNDGGRGVYYINFDFISDDAVPRITWSDGTQNSDRYITSGFGSGCSGLGGRSVVPFEHVNGKVYQSGTTSIGEPVYEFIDSQASLVQLLYGHTNGKYYVGGETRDLSLNEFIRRHGVFLYRDQSGRFNVFSNGVFGPQAECGKPVIYLYPEKPTQVSVKVGARITKSEPEYGDGWNVLAEPTGKQTLFWEGLGDGPYPEITGGFVVKRENLEATLRDHLAKLGLNARESQDFLDFWLEKMPTTPYMRLTWFGTRQMNALAPLTITPKPDTMIRIFLDFEELEKPIILPEQKLSTIPRKGFTIIEWGGLLKR